MNVRSMIFVFGLGLFLFFINQYFTSKWHQESTEKGASVEKQTVQEGWNRSGSETLAATPNQLPLSPLYEDLQGRTLLSYSVIASSGSYLTLNWQDKMPKQVYVQKSQKFLPLYLVTEGNGVGKLSLYSSAHKPEIVSTHLPKTDVQPLQFVSFEKGDVLVHVGLYENGELSFPQGSMKSSAIVLYRAGNSYLPVALYDGARSSFEPFKNLGSLENLTTYELMVPSSSTSQLPRKEDLYVLSNESMQVVFSNWGGAIAEVNLPFERESKGSAVLPIDFDRIIDRRYPSNALFPSRPFYIVEKNQSAKPVLKNPVTGGYYPLLRRGIAKGTPYPPFAISPRYYAFNVISADPETSQSLYQVTHFDSDSIEFTARFQNRKITKTYRLPKEADEAPYSLFATVRVEGDAQGLSVTSGVLEAELISGSPAPAIKYKMMQNQEQKFENLSLPKNSITLSSIRPDWVSNSNGYFTIIIDPLSEIAPGFQVDRVPGNMDPSRIAMIDSQYDLYPATDYPGYIVHMPLAQTSTPADFRLFLGPMQHHVLKKVDKAFTNQITGYNPNYIKTQSFHGWFAFISEPFAKFLLIILNFCYKITHSWGFSIILLTLVLRIIMYPLNGWSIKSTLSMQAIGPKMEKIKKKYKNDPKRKNIETMKLYKEHKVNPVGGCLPLIIQLPFLIGMFDLLKSTFSLRGTPFIPGWINNLTAPDVLFGWGYPIPLIGTAFHLLPILLGVITFFQSKMSKHQGEVGEQQKIMAIIMPAVLTVVFYKMPSGLNIYFLSSTCLQMLQQWYASKRVKPVKKVKNSKEIEIKPKETK